MNQFEDRLKGGHPNSLGNTEEVVAEVLADNRKFEELFNCYFSDDEIVRLRVSSAVKRVCIAAKSLVVPYLDRLLDEISKIDQASTQWTLSILFDLMKVDMIAAQKSKALSIMKNNLANHDDWIVLNTTMDVLAKWAVESAELKHWISPHLDRLSQDKRRSVSAKAKKMISKLEG